MSTWCVLALDEGITVCHRTDLLTAFHLAFGPAGSPTDTALFVGMEHDLVKIYFTPEASSFGKTFGAVSCEQLTRESLAQLVAHHLAWDHFHSNLRP